MEDNLTSATLRKVILALVIKEKRKPPWERTNQDRILALCHLSQQYRQREETRAIRRLWVHEVWSTEHRAAHGATHSFLNIIRIDDPDLYYNFLRMPPEIFDLLLNIVGPSIAKEYVVREPISAITRLQICLRYLATGDNEKTLAALFRVSPPSVSNIIKEVTQAIWDCLKPIVFDEINKELWLRIAQGFARKCNHPRCLGAIDSKLVKIVAPPHCGFLMFDHKGHHSFHLHAICDANGKFTIVDVGAAGRQSDGGVFQNSEMGQKFLNDEMDVPPPAPLVEGGPDIKFTLLGDEAFGMSRLMLRPYPKNLALNLRKRVFDYRHSRGRKEVECGFGQLVRVWGVMQNPMNTSLAVSLQATNACVCLHNFLIMFDETRERSDEAQNEDDEDDIIDLQMIENLKAAYDDPDDVEPRPNSLERMRWDLSQYFMNEGAVSFQWRKAFNGDF
ncbi:hypothetical protein QAD02_006733 [Eretmocerus hayati]|uniref:Uncharacterized protein n=1 Tax=Eretmocerus hayati TaxID=131215 RepID=A0ACC2N2H6_9HYME|nr:hypothetical protein QAD02_006733 [Eretmocerus hayati]